MKLVNRTLLPDKFLRRILTKCGKSVKARTGGVVVEVVNSIKYVSGTAYECDTIQLDRGGKWLTTQGGYFTLRLPVEASGRDSLNVAENAIQIARHEWGHIRDYQHGGRAAMAWSVRVDAQGRRLKRRPDHDLRPEEIRAERYVDESNDRLGAHYFDDEILDLAIIIEKIRQDK